VRFQDNDDIDREVTDAAIWFDGGSNYTIDHNTFLHDYHDMKACEGPAVSAQNILIHHNFSDFPHRISWRSIPGTDVATPPKAPALTTFRSTTITISTRSGTIRRQIPSAYQCLLHKPNNQEVASIHLPPWAG
jgi:hypothetical protein